MDVVPYELQHLSITELSQYTNPSFPKPIISYLWEQSLSQSYHDIQTLSFPKPHHLKSLGTIPVFLSAAGTITALPLFWHLCITQPAPETTELSPCLSVGTLPMS